MLSNQCLSIYYTVYHLYIYIYYTYHIISSYDICYIIYIVDHQIMNSNTDMSGQYLQGTDHLTPVVCRWQGVTWSHASKQAPWDGSQGRRLGEGW